MSVAWSDSGTALARRLGLVPVDKGSGELVHVTRDLIVQGPPSLPDPVLLELTQASEALAGFSLSVKPPLLCRIGTVDCRIG